MTHALPPEHAKILTAALSILASQGAGLKGESLLATARTALEPFVFEALNKRYGQALETHWNLCTIPKDSDKALVIVERRCHPNLEFCIRNAVYFNPGFSLHIFCSQANFEFVKYLCGKHLPNVHLYTVWPDLGGAEQGRKEYNDLLQKRSFWEQFKEEHLLLFETDSYFLRPVSPTIFAYDYVASRWSWQPDEPGGGGISYRKKSVMLDICDRYKNPATVMQDCFASEGTKALGYKYPSFEENANFFVESQFSVAAVGVHQWWTFVVQPDFKHMLNVINEFITLRM